MRGRDSGIGGREGIVGEEVEREEGGREEKSARRANGWAHSILFWRARTAL
jgi:hypothetical protein